MLSIIGTLKYVYGDATCKQANGYNPEEIQCVVGAGPGKFCVGTIINSE